MSNATDRLVKLIKATSQSVVPETTQLVSLKIKSLNPLEFTYNEKLTITSEFYDRDKNFSTANLNVGDSVKAFKINDGQTYYLLANTSGGGGGSSNYNNLTNKPQINGVTLSGNKTTSQLGIKEYPTEDKTKLAGIENNAQENVIENIKVNGTSQTITNKAVDITVPTKTSDLTNDSGFIIDYTETDPTVPQVVKNITSTDISNWNNKSDFSGSYNDLTNKPSIPTKTSDLTNDSNFTNVTEVTNIVNGAITIPSLGTLELNNGVGLPDDIEDGLYYIDALKVNGSYKAVGTNAIISIEIEGSTSQYVYIVSSLYMNRAFYINYMYEFDGSIWVDDYDRYGNSYTYGYCKLINNLSRSAYFEGEALSAYQGYLLNQNKEAKSNKVTSIDSSSTDTQYPSAKAVYDSIPTNNNQLTNGAGYQTASDVSTAINSAIIGITSISFEVVQSLPTSGNAGTIYLISNSGSAPNIYDEYIYVNNSWEKIGTTEVDLTNYYTKTQTDTLLDQKQNQLTAGSNITISNNVISATDTTNYTALSNKPQINGVTLTSNKTSANLNLVGTSDIATSITSSSTNGEVAGAKAVYDLHNTPKSYISIRNTSNITIASTGGWSSYQVKLTTIQYSNGSKFTLDDGAILIGAGVSKVKATLNMAIKGSSAETGTAIRKKASGEATWHAIYPTCNYKHADWFCTSTSVIIDVSEGDKIGAFFNTHTSGNLEINAIGTALLVEEY